MNETINLSLVKPSLRRLHLGSGPRANATGDRREIGIGDQAKVKSSEPVTYVYVKK